LLYDAVVVELMDIIKGRQWSFAVDFGPGQSGSLKIVLKFILVITSARRHRR